MKYISWMDGERLTGKRYLNAASKTLFACIVALLLGSGTVFSQAVANGRMHGAVTDSSGAAVPGAIVTATQTESGTTSTATAGAEGSYILPNLPVGPYTIKVSAPGFQSYQVGELCEVEAAVSLNGGQGGLDAEPDDEDGCQATEDV